MSETWYSSEIGDGIMAAGPAAEIETAFYRLFNSAGRPASMAVFSRLESEGRLHCEMVVYFSPAAAEIARQFEAEPCEKPARAGLGLLAGDKAAWGLLFPESAE
jgi:hypothetical protein